MIKNSFFDIIVLRVHILLNCYQLSCVINVLNSLVATALKCGHYPWTFLEIAPRIYVYFTETWFLDALVSPPLSFSLSLALSRRARKRVHKNSTKEETPLYACRVVCAIDLRHHRRRRWWRRRRETGFHRSFSRGDPILLTSGVLGTLLCYRARRKRTNVSRMKDFRREVILIALNKLRFVIIIFAYR